MLVKAAQVIITYDEFNEPNCVAVRLPINTAFKLLWICKGVTAYGVIEKSDRIHESGYEREAGISTSVWRPILVIIYVNIDAVEI